MSHLPPSRPLLSVLLSLLFSLSAFAADESIKIGAMLCQTGNCADWGTAALKGAQLAMEEINSQGGVLSRKISLTAEDTAESISGARAVTAFQKLQGENIKIFLGPSWAPGALAIAPLAAARSDIIVITPSASAPAFSRAAAHIFNMRPPEDAATRALARYAYEKGMRRAAVFSSQQPAESLQGKIFEEEFLRLGGTVTLRLEPDPALSDLRTEAAKITATNPEVVFLMNYNQLEAGARALANLGYKGLRTAISLDETRVTAAGGLFEGLIVASSGSPSEDFRTRFKKRFSEKPGLSAEFGHDAIVALAQSIKAAGTFETKSVTAALQSGKYSGAIGEFSFDANREVVSPPELFMAEGGRLAPLAATHAAANATSQRRKELVKIGAIVPLTGGSAYGGDDIAKLLPILQERLNQSSKKYEYQFVVDDGKCGVGNAAASIANKYIAIDRMKFLVAACSGEVLIAAPLAQRSGVLTFAVFSSHKDVRTLGDYIFRTFVDIERSIKSFSEYMLQRHTGSIAILTEESVFTKNTGELLKQYLGSKVTYSEEFPLDSADLSTLLERVRNKSVEAVFLNAASQGTLANLVNQARGRRIDLPLYSYFYAEMPGFTGAVGKNARGLTFLGAPELSNASREVREALSEFQKRYGRKQNSDLVFGATFDAVKAMTDGIEAVGADPALVKEYLKSYQSQGALGKLEFDENGDVKFINFALKRIEADGKFTIIDSLRD